MTVPSELPGIGSTAQRLRQNPGFDPVAGGIGPEEYFVWTRFDGATSVKDLIMMTGLPEPRAIEIVRRLRALGAILLPDEKADQVVRPPARTAAGTDRPATEAVDVAVEERDRILAMHARVQKGDPLAILGVADATDKKAIKRAYFALSKEFHPDRYFGKRTGSYGAQLDAIFEAINKAYAALTDGRARRASSVPGHAAAPSPTDHAADLFERACQAEVSGDLAGALRLFASALRLDAPARYLRRAARCALAAKDTPLALEYAKKAANLDPNDPSTARVLAQAFRAVGKLDDAEEVLVLALMIKSENDQLRHEMQSDLAEIRRLSSRQSSESHQKR